MGDFHIQPEAAALRQHSPTPWELVEATEHHGPYICNVYGGDVCDLYAMSNPGAFSTRNGGSSYPVPFTDADANAAFIVEAVNNYDKLRGDLEDAQIELRNLGNMGVAALKSQVEELTKALEPFAEIAKELVPTLTDDYKNTMAWAVPTVGQLREALRALAPSLEGRGGAT